MQTARSDFVMPLTDVCPPCQNQPMIKIALAAATILVAIISFEIGKHSQEMSMYQHYASRYSHLFLALDHAASKGHHRDVQQVLQELSQSPPVLLGPAQDEQLKKLEEMTHRLMLNQEGESGK